MGIWDEQGTSASFEILGDADRVTFSISSIARSGGNRLAKRERVYRDGELVDGMGSKGDTIATRSLFFNGLKEPGVSETALYPDELNKLLDLLKASNAATGTLRLPTTKPRKVKAERWDIHEAAERPDYAALDITWFENNEEVELESTFGETNARSAAVAIADDIAAQIEFMGITSADVEELKSIAAKLEELAQFAGERGDDLLQAAADARQATANIEASFVPSGQDVNSDNFVVGEDAFSLLGLPIAYATLINLRAFAEMAAKAAENVPGRARPVPTLFKQTLTLWDIAIDHGVDIEELSKLNPTLDPGFIPANTTVLLPGAT